MPLSLMEQNVLSVLDEQGLIGAFRDLARIPSITGQESVAQNWLAQHMQRIGLDVDLWMLRNCRNTHDFLGWRWIGVITKLLDW